MPSLVSAAQQASMKAALHNVWETFARPLTVYIESQTVNINTSSDYSRFGQHDQMVFDPQVTPQRYTITGCILYAPKQGYPYAVPYDSSDATQLKIRNSDGEVRVKVDASGYALMFGAKTIVLDGFTFTNDSTPRPHGLIGAPDRWSFRLTKAE